MYNRNAKSSGHRFLERSPSVSHYCHQHCHPASLRPETTLPTPPGDRCLVSLIRGLGWAVPTTPTSPGCVPLTPVAPPQPGDRVQRPTLTQALTARRQSRDIWIPPLTPCLTARPLVAGQRDRNCAGQRHCHHLLTVPGLCSHPAMSPRLAVGTLHYSFPAHTPGHLQEN